MKNRWLIKFGILILVLSTSPNVWTPSVEAATKYGKGDPTCKGNGCFTVPEIDATGTVPALTLLGGALALLLERKRRK